MANWKITRRALLKRAAAAGTYPWLLRPVGANCQMNPTTQKMGGFKIGAVDWELTKPGDPGALEVAARLGFDGLQIDLADVDTMRDPARQARFQQLAREHHIEIASLALGILNSVPGKAPGCYIAWKNPALRYGRSIYYMVS